MLSLKDFKESKLPNDFPHCIKGGEDPNVTGGGCVLLHSVVFTNAAGTTFRSDYYKQWNSDYGNTPCDEYYCYDVIRL